MNALVFHDTEAHRYIASAIIILIAMCAGAFIMWPWVQWEQHHRKVERERKEMNYVWARHEGLEELSRMFQEQQAKREEAQRAKDDAFFETVEEMHRDFNSDRQAG
jgi:predicted Holliday junction resolvase-like endonuclease